MKVLIVICKTVNIRTELKMYSVKKRKKKAEKPNIVTWKNILHKSDSLIERHLISDKFLSIKIIVFHFNLRNFTLDISLGFLYIYWLSQNPFVEKIFWIIYIFSFVQMSMIVHVLLWIMHENSFLFIITLLRTRRDCQFEDHSGLDFKAKKTLLKLIDKARFPLWRSFRSRF